jgi:hypothetical protein
MTTDKPYLEYDDDYPTCNSTHATLCVYLPIDYDPIGLSDKLGIQPSRKQVSGELRNGKVKRWPTAWFLESSEKVRSKDVRRHIDWLLQQINTKSDVIKELQDIGSEVHISCFWVSAVGHGGPTLDQNILKRIADLNIGIDFDIYFAGDVINEAFNKT